MDENNFGNFVEQGQPREPPESDHAASAVPASEDAFAVVLISVNNHRKQQYNKQDMMGKTPGNVEDGLCGGMVSNPEASHVDHTATTKKSNGNNKGSMASEQEQQMRMS